MSMAGYTKLFNSILASTIWREDDKTRIVWITLLAMADKHGIAEGSIPGIADFARVSVEDCRQAITKLSAPDIDSRSQEHEGRRIAAVDGGWQLLNHDKYRRRLSADERREYLKVKQREYRASRQHQSTPVNNVSDTDTVLTQAEAEAEAEAEKDAQKSRAREVQPSAIDTRAAAFLETYAELYAKHRHGAKTFRRRPSLDWDQARGLCRTWDDARLVKMADILLTTDDEWVSKTDRGFGVFVARAQWCDERLSAWEAAQRGRS